MTGKKPRRNDFGELARARREHCSDLERAAARRPEPRADQGQAVLDYLSTRVGTTLASGRHRRRGVRAVRARASTCRPRASLHVQLGTAATTSIATIAASHTLERLSARAIATASATRFASGRRPRRRRSPRARPAASSRRGKAAAESAQDGIGSKKDRNRLLGGARRPQRSQSDQAVPVAAAKVLPKAEAHRCTSARPLRYRWSEPFQPGNHSLREPVRIPVLAPRLLGILTDSRTPIGSHPIALKGRRPLPHLLGTPSPDDRATCWHRRRSTPGTPHARQAGWSTLPAGRCCRLQYASDRHRAQRHAQRGRPVRRLSHGPHFASPIRPDSEAPFLGPASSRGESPRRMRPGQIRYALVTNQLDGRHLPGRRAGLSPCAATGAARAITCWSSTPAIRQEDMGLGIDGTSDGAGEPPRVRSDATDTAMIAVQGPCAVDIVRPLVELRSRHCCATITVAEAHDCRAPDRHRQPHGLHRRGRLRRADRAGFDSALDVSHLRENN